MPAFSAIPCLGGRGHPHVQAARRARGRGPAPAPELTREIAWRFNNFYGDFFSRAAGHTDPGGQMPWPGRPQDVQKLQ